MKRLFAILLTVVMVMSLATGVFADSWANSTIDTTRTGSLTLHKYDLTEANKDPEIAAMLAEYVSTGVADADLEAAMAEYAIQGVEYKYLKVADIVTYSETESNGTHKDMILYKINDTTGAAFLTALGLSTSNAYAVQSSGASGFVAEAGCHYYEPGVLINALKNALADNSTTVKNALEAYMTAQNASAMPETSAAGESSVNNLALGLYLIVESRVPENVMSTTNPFLVSVPMTSINGTNATDGGNRWIYDVEVYPKNETADPDLLKQVREAKADTATHDGSDNAGWDNTATASSGDKVDYRLISHLPPITSDASAFTVYSFTDVLSKGLEYNGNEAVQNLLNGHFNANDVEIRFYKDAALTDLVATWKEDDATPRFVVDYDPPVETGENAPANDGTSMQIVMTEAGLNEINKTGTYDGRDALEQGYSRLYMKITYSATLNQNADLVLGDAGNNNTVTLEWKRTNSAYSDTLTDADNTVYSYAIDLTKVMGDGATDKFRDVKFLLHNDTDDYFVVAEESATEPGVWYVKGHDVEANATALIPAANTGKLVIYGLEADTYSLKEIETASGYQLLKDAVVFVVSTQQIVDDQKADNELGRTSLTASATIDGDAVVMEAQGTSANAMVPIQIMNPIHNILPGTGMMGNMWFMGGIVAAMGLLIGLVIVLKRKERKEDAANA